MLFLHCRTELVLSSTQSSTFPPASCPQQLQLLISFSAFLILLKAHFLFSLLYAPFLDLMGSYHYHKLICFSLYFFFPNFLLLFQTSNHFSSCTNALGYLKKLGSSTSCCLCPSGKCLQSSAEVLEDSFCSLDS